MSKEAPWSVPLKLGLIHETEAVHTDFQPVISRRHLLWVWGNYPVVCHNDGKEDQGDYEFENRLGAYHSTANAPA